MDTVDVVVLWKVPASYIPDREFQTSVLSEEQDELVDSLAQRPELECWWTNRDYGFLSSSRSIRVFLGPRTKGG